MSITSKRPPKVADRHCVGRYAHDSTQTSHLTHPAPHDPVERPHAECKDPVMESTRLAARRMRRHAGRPRQAFGHDRHVRDDDLCSSADPAVGTRFHAPLQPRASPTGNVARRRASDHAFDCMERPHCRSGIVRRQTVTVSTGTSLPSPVRDQTQAAIVQVFLPNRSARLAAGRARPGRSRGYRGGFRRPPGGRGRAAEAPRGGSVSGTGWSNGRVNTKQRLF